MTQRNDNLDTELNLVPIIDCFVMLICFLLFTAAFTQIVFLEAKITENTVAAMDKSRNELEKFHLVVQLEADQSFHIKLTGSEVKNSKFKVPANAEGNFDFAALHLQLIKIRAQNPDRFSIDVEMNNKKIHYQALMKTIDSVRHLDDMEYSQLQTANKIQNNIALDPTEENREITEEIAILAESIANNKVAAETDRKVLFPDIAITGI